MLVIICLASIIIGVLLQFAGDWRFFSLIFLIFLSNFCSVVLFALEIRC